MITREEIIKALQTVHDPEIPVNIWDLGLVYEIIIKEQEQGIGRGELPVPGSCSLRDAVTLKMTMTSPTCPMAEEIMQMAREAVGELVGGANNVTTELVWDPPWDLSRMSELARLELDLTEEGW